MDEFRMNSSGKPQKLHSSHVCTISHARATRERQIGESFFAGRLIEGPIFEAKKVPG
jgi:hypothetical protein